MIISLEVHDDTLIWAMEENGELSVKSAYCLFRDMNISSGEGKISNASWQKPSWKDIWKL